MKITGGVVLLTGANGGIGVAITHQLADKGASLILTGRDTRQLQKLANELRPTGSGVQIIASDLGEPGMPQRLVESALKKAARIDIVINCAGVQNFGFLADESPGDTARLFHTNTIAPIALVNAVLPHMLRNRAGHLVNVGSIFGSIGFPCFATYSASKFALRGFSEALRRELNGTGIAVTCVAPRFTKTSMNGSAVTRMAQALGMNQDDPADVAASVIAEIECDGKERYLGWPEKLFVRLNALFPPPRRPVADETGRRHAFICQPAARVTLPLSKVCHAPHLYL